MTRQALEEKKLASQEAIAAEKNRHEKEMQKKEHKFKKGIHTEDIAFGLIPKVGIKLGTGKNDPAFYKQYIKDVENFTHLTTFDRLGSASIRGFYNASGNNKLSVPGILVIPWMSSVGPEGMLSVSSINNTENFPVNVGLGRMLQKVLELNSRSGVPYDKEDLGLNMFCSCDIATLIVELGRAIQVYNTYYTDNAYFAKHLITALGFNFSDMAENIADYRKAYIRLSTLFNKSVVAPSFATLYARRLYLASNVFIDSEDANYPRQIYAFKIHSALRLNDAGSGADMESISTTTLHNVITTIEKRITRIIDNPDYSEMYNDLRFAYGSDILQLPVEGVVDKPISLNTDPLNREQIHNLKTLPLVRGREIYTFAPMLSDLRTTMSLRTINGQLVQGGNIKVRVIDPNLATYEYRFVRGYVQGFANSTHKDMYVDWCVSQYGRIYSGGELSPATGAQLLDMHKREISGDDILDITRTATTLEVSQSVNVIAGEHPDSNNCIVEILSSGTEVCLWFEMYLTYSDSTTYVDEVLTHFSYGSMNLISDYKELLTASMLTVFDWMPITSFLADASGATQYGVFADLHTTFKISSSDVDAINTICVLSELFADKAKWSRG